MNISINPSHGKTTEISDKLFSFYVFYAAAGRCAAVGKDTDAGKNYEIIYRAYLDRFSSPLEKHALNIFENNISKKCLGINDELNIPFDPLLKT